MAVYLVGREDYQKGEEGLAQFKQDLKTFIDRSLTLKSGKGSFAVIQKPFACGDTAENTLMEKYVNAVDEVVAVYGENKRVVVVDHYTQTNSSDNFKNSMLIETGVPNADGHHEIGRQLVAAVMGNTNHYPASAVTVERREEAQPHHYVDVLPAITASDNSLEVVIPAGNGEAWSYEVDMEGIIIRGEAQTPSFQILGLVQGKEYQLKLTSADGSTRLTTMKGRITEGSTAIADIQTLNQQQQKLAELLESKGEEGLTWLFMGDSITHGAIATSGYDSLPQLFEKYVRGELDRSQDTVVNTAVYATDTKRTLANIAQRMDKYQPDVVALMLGTNDAKPALNIPIDDYEENIEEMIDRIRRINPEAVIILRSLIHTWDANHQANVPAYSERLREIAQEDGNILFIDQFTWTTDYMETYPWLKTTGGNYMYFDALHPDANGQLLLFRQFLKETGLWKEDTSMTNLVYQLPVTERKVETVPVLNVENVGSITCSLADVTNSSGVEDLGAFRLKAVDNQSGQSYEVAVKYGAETLELTGLPNSTYEVILTGWRRTEAEKLVFAHQQVRLGAVADLEPLQRLITEAEGKAEAEYTAESWEELVQALTQAKAVVESGSQAEQTAVDTAKNNLQKALDGLKEKEKESADKQMVETPVFSLAAGTYTGEQSVMITIATEEATIYYTVDGSTPTTESREYTQKISISQSMTLKAIAVKEGMENSAVAEAVYVIQIPDFPDSVKEMVKIPTFSVPAGTYSKAQKVTLTSATKGATIYYTTDGTVPTTSSLKYSQAIPVEKTMTLKAIAVKEGMNNSTIAVAAYTIKEEVKEKEWMFIDVPVISDNWKYESVKYVYNQGVMGAITETREFQPDRPLSRSMFATVLYRMAGEPQVNYQAKFSDVPAGKWYSNAIIWAYQNKIVSGMGNSLQHYGL